jgi:hypothetical protein
MVLLGSTACFTSCAFYLLTSAQHGPHGEPYPQAKVTGTGEAMYDQRLFNQEGGMGHGLVSDDAYNLYDKPMFADRGTGLHRAKAAADDEEGGKQEAPSETP